MRKTLVFTGLGALLSLGFFTGITLGPVSIPFPRVWQTLFGNPEASWAEKVIVWELRLPRAVLGTLVGGTLACVGTVIQGIFRNPLADPYVLGLASGASAGAAAVIKLGFATGRPWALTVGALAGGGLVTAAVALLGRSRGGLSPLALILAGVSLATLFSAITATLIFFASPEERGAILIWTMGGLNRATRDMALILGALVALGLPALLAFSRDLDALALGDAQAFHLGTHPDRARAVLLFISTMLTATAVAFAGPISFVGLIVPHAMRLLLGPRHFPLLLAAFLGGAMLLVWADLGARMILQPVELPVGLITAFLGVPFFLAILKRRWTA